MGCPGMAQRMHGGMFAATTLLDRLEKGTLDPSPPHRVGGSREGCIGASAMGGKEPGGVGVRMRERMERTSSMLRTTGNLCSLGARTKSRMGQGRRRVCSKRNLMAHRVTVLVLRATCFSLRR